MRWNTVSQESEVRPAIKLSMPFDRIEIKKKKWYKAHDTSTSSF